MISLQGQGCSGCSVSFLNIGALTTVDHLLTDRINLEYHSTLITDGCISRLPRLWLFSLLLSLPGGFGDLGDVL